MESQRKRKWGEKQFEQDVSSVPNNQAPRHGIKEVQKMQIRINYIIICIYSFFLKLQKIQDKETFQKQPRTKVILKGITDQKLVLATAET